MMAQNKRLIDANDPLKQLSSYMEKLHCSTDYIDGLCRGMEIAESYIKNAPTVDAVEVVHGWWMPRYDRCWIDGQQWITGYHCSACMGFNKAKSHYCPNCGAKMDGGNEDG